MEFISFPWEKQESILYDIFTYSDEKAGLINTGVLSMRTEDAGDLINFYTDIDGIDNNEKEHSFVTVNKKNLLPIRSKLNLSGRFGNAEVNTEYGKSVIKIIANTTKSGELRRKMNYSGEVIDDSQMFFFLRCLDFKETSTYTAKIAFIKVGQVADMEIKYWGNEKVVVTNKEIECMRVSVNTLLEPDKRQYFLYSNDTNRKLIKFVQQNNVVQINEKFI